VENIRIQNSVGGKNSFWHIGPHWLSLYRNFFVSHWRKQVIGVCDSSCPFCASDANGVCRVEERSMITSPNG